MNSFCTLCQSYKLHVIILLLGLTLHTVDCISQNFCDTEYSKKSQTLLINADSLQLRGSKKALGLYKKAIEEDTLNIDARFQLAKIYLDKLIVASYDILISAYADFYAYKAEEQLLKCVEQCESYNDYSAFYYLGSLYFNKKEYNLAGYFLDEYLHKSINKDFAYKHAQGYYKKYIQWKKWNNSPSKAIAYPLQKLNTNDFEYTPSISHDGQIMFYTRNYNKTNKNTFYAEVTTDAFYSYVIGIDSTNNWIYSEGEIAFNIENKTIESFSLSADKKTVYLSVCENIRQENKMIKDCDIYISNYNGHSWDDPVPLNGSINKVNSFEGYPCISANGDVLYFSSNSFNSLGGKDLYYCIRDSANNWSKPINMGAEINTINDEIAPFLSFDNKTLYFSSNGHFGLGGFDIFYVQNNSNKWNKPINLGKPYNNNSDNIFFITDARGLYAYFDSNTDFTYGGSDILAIKIDEQFRPQSKMIINIKVNSTDSLNSLEPDLFIQDIFSKQSIPLVRSNKQDYYSAIVDIDKSTFMLKLNNPNCIYSNKIIQTNSSYAIFESVNFSPLYNGSKFSIDDLLTKSEPGDLTKNERIILNDFAIYLKVNNLKIRIISNYYSVTYGEADEKRAISIIKQIKNELVSYGVNPLQIELKAVDLFVIKKDELAARKNSKVQFEIIEK